MPQAISLNCSDTIQCNNDNAGFLFWIKEYPTTLVTKQKHISHPMGVNVIKAVYIAFIWPLGGNGTSCIVEDNKENTKHNTDVYYQVFIYISSRHKATD